MPAQDTTEFRFVWWNVGGLAHFDRERVSERSWPRSQVEAKSRVDRICAVLTELAAKVQPSLITLGEVTRLAAEEVAARVFPAFGVFSLDRQPFARHHLAIVYDRRLPFSNADALTIPRSPRDTRAMVCIDLTSAGHRIRFFGCHWTALDTETSKKTRADAASLLNRTIFDFLHGATTESRHAVIVGDLNEEPFSETIQQRLHAFRDRQHARRREHWTDADTARVRLYNCCWRLLGEKHPHPRQGPAGSYYWERQGTWHSVDQILVTGSLLGNEPPFLDETTVEVWTGASIDLVDGFPRMFRWDKGNMSGLSDHLPVVGSLKLPTELCHANI